MTVEIFVKCDARSCTNEREISDYTDKRIKSIGWHIDYSTGFHYCPQCWIIVQEELKNITEGD